MKRLQNVMTVRLPKEDLKIIEENAFLVVYEIDDSNFIPPVNILSDYIVSGSRLEFKKNDASGYTVKLLNVTGNVRLALNESYHSRWEVTVFDPLYLKERTGLYVSPTFFGSAQNDNLPTINTFTLFSGSLLGKATKITETHQFLSNGYANGWRIDGQEASQTDLIIIYRSQYVFYLGVLSFIAVVVGWVFFFRKVL